MKKPEIPNDEPKRQAALNALDVLDTSAEERFDCITRLEQKHFGVAIALVSLVDTNRQWSNQLRDWMLSKPRVIFHSAVTPLTKMPFVVFLTRLPPLISRIILC